MAEDLNNNQAAPADLPLPQANASASGGAGGAGGQAITLSYSNNYSSLLLMYTFLLNLANGTGASTGEGMKAEMNLLLPMLQAAMEDEKKYREAFLTAVQSLAKQ
ncbi:hypothetical protein GC093_22675 [Paenibacillus sp. LMG 31456]|uniref:Uncharacterized protein n=1 Tax=Paenibacillus foliorum TaxID=2654974 RepID=A0A972GSF3_9BACL|nr:hypothetical protein [Paenibacillus foliorum]NOU96004.1 hypothetical protein [Paenibacillus foliorum]